MTIENIKDKLVDFVITNEGKYKNYFIGLSPDPYNDLFNFHKITTGVIPYRHILCQSNEDALMLLNHFSSLGCQKEEIAINSTTPFVYIYKKGFGTRP